MEMALEALFALPTKPSNPVSADIDVKKVHEAASAHYKDLTVDQKKAARSIFDTMDKDKNGNISFDEFRTFLSDVGLQTVDPDGLFAELDKDSSETLSFEELVTFFYILSRDEYKHLLKRQGWTIGDFSRLYHKFKGVNKPEERVNLRNSTRDLAGVYKREEPVNRRFRSQDLVKLYDKFKGTYKLEELASENSCTII